MLNIAVIFGGKSVEHEVSVITGLQALHALDKSRYNPIPLSIMGYGAGAGVTAAGVFADILRTVSWNPEV